MAEPLLLRYMQPLLAGRRAECVSLISHAMNEGWSPHDLIADVVWPSMTQVERLYRDDRINSAIENMACRINRMVSSQLQPHMPKAAPNGKRALISCAADPREELGGQMVADLFQADGWDVYFIGGGVPDDEILSLVGELRPDVFVIYGAKPGDVPATRRLIELIREVGVGATMNVVVSGGVFNRAEGLWQEVGADVHGGTAREVLSIAQTLKPRDPAAAPRVSVVKKRRRRRKLAAC
jgi:methanogenic corrinoid protein MtbC1